MTSTLQKNRRELVKGVGIPDESKVPASGNARIINKLQIFPDVRSCLPPGARPFIFFTRMQLGFNLTTPLAMNRC